jgi:hypothetical protein
MRPSAIALLMTFWAGTTFAGAIAVGNDPPVDQDKDKEAAATAEKPEEFKPPDGFIAKKRGKLILYCSTITPIGTRIKAERCYSEDQMRDYAIALQENKRDIDRVRSICSNEKVCGRPEAAAGPIKGPGG